jgi:hypothetical protein
VFYGRDVPPVAPSRLTANVQATHPHNEFLRVAAEQGLVGLALYLAVLAIPLYVSCRWIRGMPVGPRAVGAALWGGALGYVAQAAVGKAAMSWDFAVPWWMLMGVLAGAALGRRPDGEREAWSWRPGRRTWAAVVAVALVAALCWWQWGLRSYRSMLRLGSAKRCLVQLMRGTNREANLRRFPGLVAAARPGSLWPVRVLKYDYAAGAHLQSAGQRRLAIEWLEHVQSQAPAYVDVEYRLGRAYLDEAAAEASV